MSLEKDIKNLVLIVLAIIIAIFLWRALWSLAGLVVFILLVYIVYLFLRGQLRF